MPIYIIECENCKYNDEIITTYEKLQELLDKPCEKCHNGKVKNKISGSNFCLQGSGYYKPGFNGIKSKK